MVIQHTNYYQTWIQLGSVQSARVKSAVVVPTARWSCDQTYRNDWRIAGNRIDWLAKPAPVVPGALWTTPNGAHVSYRNDWGLLGSVHSYLAQGEPFVEPEVTTDPSGPRPAPYLDEDEEEILILMAAAEYYGLFK